MKRAESQIHSFFSLFENEIRVQFIAEPLFVVAGNENAIATAAYLLEQGYDECGVSTGGSVRQIVKRTSLVSGTVGHHGTSVPLERLVSPSTPVWACMTRLADHRSLFVLGDHGVDWIVTLADLDKQPGRLLVFGLISMLEMVMLSLLRRRYENEEWLELISKRRLAKAERLNRLRREADQQIDLLECVQLCDKFKMCLETDDLRDALGLDEEKGRKLFKDLEDVRNNLAHGQSAANGRKWIKVVKTLQDAHTMLVVAIDVLRNNSSKVFAVSSLNRT